MLLYERLTFRRRPRYYSQLDNPVARGLIKPGDPPVNQLSIREMVARDHRRAAQVRADNQRWLAPWEASVAPGYPPEDMELEAFIRRSARLVRQRRYYPFAVYADDQLVGQVTIGDIALGASHSGNLGYWVAEAYSGRGVINIRPENNVSLRVVQKLGLRFEGRKQDFYCIAGSWADHLGYAATAEEIPAGGYLAQLEKRASLKGEEA